MRRTTALILAVLMVFGFCCAGAEEGGQAAGWGSSISGELQAPSYHRVLFTAEGETIHSVLVAYGAAVGTLPEAPSVPGKWFAPGCIPGRSCTTE